MQQHLNDQSMHESQSDSNYAAPQRSSLNHKRTMSFSGNRQNRSKVLKQAQTSILDGDILLNSTIDVIEPSQSTKNAIRPENTNDFNIENDQLQASFEIVQSRPRKFRNPSFISQDTHSRVSSTTSKRRKPGVKEIRVHDRHHTPRSTSSSRCARLSMTVVKVNPKQPDPVVVKASTSPLAASFNQEKLLLMAMNKAQKDEKSKRQHTMQLTD